MSLTIGRVDYHPFNKSIKLKTLSLKTNDSMYDASKISPLQSLAFDSVVIQNFSIWKVVSSNIIQAGEVLTARPELVFRTSMNRVDTATNVENQFKFLSEYTPNTIIPLKFDIIKIKYGTIEYNSDSSALPVGSADFSIELHDFNTLDNSLSQDSNSFVFSKRIIIDVSSLVRNLKNGRVLRVKKIEFDSQAENLKISNTSLSGIETGVLDSIMIKNVSLNGISLRELGNVEHLKLNSILMDSSYLSIFPQRRKINNSNSYRKIADEIVNFVKIFQVDTINVNRLFVDGFVDDKIIFGISGLDFGVNNFLIDSTLIAEDLLPDYSNLLFNLDSIEVLGNINVNANDISYSSDKSNLSISNFKHFTDSLTNNIYCKKIIIDDITLKRLFDNLVDSNIKMKIVEPEITYYLKAKDKNSVEINDSEIIRSLLFRSIDIVNAKLKLIKPNDFEILSQNVNMNLKFKSNITLDSIVDSKNIEYLVWTSGQTEFENQNENISIKLSSSKYDDNNELLFYNGSLKSKQDNTNVETLLFAWKELGLTNFDLHGLIDNEAIISSSVFLVEPNINLVVNNIVNSESVRYNDFVQLPLKVGFNNFMIKNGILHIEVKHDNYSQILSSNFNLEFGRFYTDGLMNLQELLDIDINTNFRDINFSDKFFVTHADNLSFTTSDSTINLHNIDISNDSLNFKSLKNGQGHLTIDELSLKDIYLSEMSNKEQFHFATLKMKNPNLNMSFEIDTNYISKNKSNRLFPEINVFDKLELSGFNLNMKYKSNNSINRISFDSSNILWQETNSNSNLDEVFLKMNNLNYNNELNNIEFKIDTIYSNHKSDDLIIKNLSYIKKRNENNGGLSVKFPNLNIYDLLLNKNNISELEVRLFESDSLFLKVENLIQEKGKFDIKKVEDNLIGVFSKLYVRDLKIENAGIQIYNISDSITKLSELLDFKIQMQGLGYSPSDSGNVLPDFIKVNLKDNYFLTYDSLYEFRADKLKYSFIDNSFIIDSISIKPTLGVKEYFKYFGYQTDRFNVYCSQIVGSGFNIDKYVENNTYLIDKIDLFEVSTTIFRDKTYEFKHGIEKLMPTELIMKIQPSFLIDSLEIHDSRIVYGEYVNKSSEPGEVTFEDFNLTASNITNISSNIQSNSSLDINFNTRLMGQPKLTAELNIPLDKTNKFSFNGHTEEMDFGIFNSMTQNLFGISVIRGKGSFDINNVVANDSISRGFLTFKYKKLRIALYDREKAALNRGVASPFFNFLVNDLLIKSNNPHFFGSTRKGLVYFERDEERSFLNYIWKSLVSGMMSTMWHNSKEQRIERRRLKKFNK